MIIIDKNIEDLLPNHYKEYAPRLILFLKKYYDWLYRSSGMSDSEVAMLRGDTSWLKDDIDKFISSGGDVKYIDSIDHPEIVDEAIINLNNTDGSGEIADELSNNFSLDEMFSEYLTTDNSTFTDINDISVELNTVENTVLDSWFNSIGLDRIKRRRMTSLNSIDQVLMLSLMKHIYAIKGTETSIKLFFSLYFDEDVTIYYPKNDILLIDDNWVLESTKVIRDDEEYQEYSYVILVSDDVSTYKDIFESIYIKTVHPSGFRVALRQI